MLILPPEVFSARVWMLELLDLLLYKKAESYI
jgi:hypothetical protein